MNQKGNKDNPNKCIVKCNLKSLYHVQSMFTLNGLSKKKKKKKNVDGISCDNHMVEIQK